MSYAWIVFGAGAVAGVVLAKLVGTFKRRSLTKVLTAPLRHAGDDATVTVFGFNEAHVIPNAVTDVSPFVSRVEVFCLLGRIPFVKIMSSPADNPRSKLPFANVRGKMVDDSERIIETIKARCGFDPDADLTEQQAATGHLIREMLTQSLYWVELHNSFVTPEGQRNFAISMRKRFGGVLGRLITAFVLNVQLENLWGQGFGRLTRAEIIKRGLEDLKTLNTVLDGHQFFLGTPKPTQTDTDAYAFLANLLLHQAPSQAWVGEAKQRFPNLLTFMDRMQAILFKK